MRTLITGASGFIGMELIKELQKTGENELFGISRQAQTGTQNLKWLMGDLNDANFVDSLARMGFEKVFHLSWEGLPDRGKFYSELNFKNSIRFLGALSKPGSVELNIIGSCLEYGNITGSVSDSEIPHGNDDFALSKLAIHSFVQGLGVPYRWFRPFYIYGFRQNPKSLIPSIISALSAGNEIEVKAINNSHDFISIDDLTTAIARSSSNQTILGEINIGTGEPTCVGDILLEFHNYYRKPFHQTYSRNPGLFAQPDVLIKDAGWKPTHVGAKGVIEYFRTKQAISSA